MIRVQYIIEFRAGGVHQGGVRFGPRLKNMQDGTVRMHARGVLHKASFYKISKPEFRPHDLVTA